MRIKTILMLSVAVTLSMLSFGVGHVLAGKLVVAPGGLCNGDPVVGSFETIADAVAAASQGDKIDICPGTYNEAVTITTSKLKIRGTEEVDSGTPTTLDGDNTEAVGITIVADVINITLDNLIFENYTQAAVQVEEGPTKRIHVEDCEFHNNVEGVVVEHTGGPLLPHAFSRVRRSVFTGTTGTNVRFVNCTSCRVQRSDITGGDIGIHYLADDNGANKLVNNRMLLNEIRDVQSVGIKVEAAAGGSLRTPNATKNIVEDTVSGPGILFVTQADGTIDRGKILRNDVTCSVPANEDIVLDEAVVGSISKTTVKNNTSTGCAP